MPSPMRRWRVLLSLFAVGCNSYLLQDTGTQLPRTEVAFGADGTGVDGHCLISFFESAWLWGCARSIAFADWRPFDIEEIAGAVQLAARMRVQI